MTRSVYELALVPDLGREALRVIDLAEAMAVAVAAGCTGEELGAVIVAWGWSPNEDGEGEVRTVRIFESNWARLVRAAQQGGE